MFDMEIQIICQPSSPGDFAQKLGIAIPFYLSPSTRNKFLDSLDFLKMPNHFEFKKKLEDVYQITDSPVGPNGESMISLEDIFFVDYADDETADYVNDRFSGFFSYYYYNGSVTYPPCDGLQKLVI